MASKPDGENSRTVADFIYRLECSAKKILKDANKKQKQAARLEQTRLLLGVAKNRNARDKMKKAGVTVHLEDTVNKSAIDKEHILSYSMPAMTISMSAESDDAVGEGKNVESASDMLRSSTGERKRGIPESKGGSGGYSPMKTSKSLDSTHIAASLAKIDSKIDSRTKGKDAAKSTALTQSVVLEHIQESPFLPKDMSFEQFQKTMKDKQIDPNKIEEKDIEIGEHNHISKRNLALKATNALGNRQPPNPKIYHQLLKQKEAAEGHGGTEPLILESQGPIDWSHEGIRMKFRGEDEREALFQKWNVAKNFSDTSFSQDEKVIPIGVIERHPLFRLRDQLMDMENFQSCARTRQRLMMKRFVLDVHEVWLSNLKHLREHDPVHFLGENLVEQHYDRPYDAETDRSLVSAEEALLSERSRNLYDKQDGGLVGRRDVAAIVGLESQIQSVSLPRVMNKAYHTSALMQDSRVILDYKAEPTPALQPTMEPPPYVDSILNAFPLYFHQHKSKDDQSLNDDESLDASVDFELGAKFSTEVFTKDHIPLMVYVDRLIPPPVSQSAAQASAVPTGERAAGGETDAHIEDDPAVTNVNDAFQTRSVDLMWRVTVYDSFESIAVSCLLRESTVAQAVASAITHDFDTGSLSSATPQVTVFRRQRIKLLTRDITTQREARSMPLAESFDVEIMISEKFVSMPVIRDERRAGISGQDQDTYDRYTTKVVEVECKLTPSSLEPRHSVGGRLSLISKSSAGAPDEAEGFAARPIYLLSTTAELRHALALPQLPFSDVEWWTNPDRGVDFWPYYCDALLVSIEDPDAENPMNEPGDVVYNVSLREIPQESLASPSEADTSAFLLPALDPSVRANFVPGALDAIQARACVIELINCLAVRTDFSVYLQIREALSVPRRSIIGTLGVGNGEDTENSADSQTHVSQYETRFYRLSSEPPAMDWTWELDADAQPCLSLRVSGGVTRVSQVPGSCQYGKYGLWEGARMVHHNRQPTLPKGFDDASLGTEASDESDEEDENGSESSAADDEDLDDAGDGGAISPISSSMFPAASHPRNIESPRSWEGNEGEGEGEGEEGGMIVSRVGTADANASPRNPKKKKKLAKKVQIKYTRSVVSPKELRESYPSDSVWYLRDEIDFTRAAATFYRNHLISTLDSVHVLMTLAIEMPCEFGTMMAWEDSDGLPPLTPSDAVGGVVPNFAVPYFKIFEKKLLSPIAVRSGSCVRMLQKIAEEGFDFEPANAVFHPAGSARHTPPRSERGFRQREDVMLLGVDPIIPTNVFGITRSGALPNATGVNPRNIWHNVTPVVEDITRPRTALDYKYIISNDQTTGANDPTTFLVRLAGTDFLSLISSALRRFEQVYSEIGEKRVEFAKQIALQSKLQRSDMLIKIKQKELMNSQQKMMQMQLQKKFRKTTKSEVGWRKRILTSTLMEVQGVWEKRRDDRNGLMFFHMIGKEGDRESSMGAIGGAVGGSRGMSSLASVVSQIGGAETLLHPEDELYSETCQWEVPDAWIGDPLYNGAPVHGFAAASDDVEDIDDFDLTSNTGAEEEAFGHFNSQDFSPTRSPSKRMGTPGASPTRRADSAFDEPADTWTPLTSTDGTEDLTTGGVPATKHKRAKFAARMVGTGPAVSGDTSPVNAPHASPAMSRRPSLQVSTGYSNNDSRAQSRPFMTRSSMRNAYNSSREDSAQSVQTVVSFDDEMSPRRQRDRLNSINDVDNLIDHLANNDTLVDALARKLGFAQSRVGLDTAGSGYDMASPAQMRFGRSDSVGFNIPGESSSNMPSSYNSYDPSQNASAVPSAVGGRRATVSQGNTRRTTQSGDNMAFDSPPRAPRPMSNPLGEPNDAFDSEDEMWSDEDDPAGNYLFDENEPMDFPSSHKERADLYRRSKHVGGKPMVRKKNADLDLHLRDADGQGIDGTVDESYDTSALRWRKLPRPDVSGLLFENRIKKKTLGPNTQASDTVNQVVAMAPVAPADACLYEPVNEEASYEVIFVSEPRKDLARAFATLKRNVKREEELSKNVPTDDLLLFGKPAEKTKVDEFVIEQYRLEKEGPPLESQVAFEKALVAAKSDNLAEIEAALDADISVETMDSYGNTLLLLAAQQGSKRMCKFLLRRGANVNAQNAVGNTVLHFCYQYKKFELGEYLKKIGADDTILNMAGLTCYEGLDESDIDI